MLLSTDCMYCISKRQMEAISKYDDETLKSDYMKAVYKILAESLDGDTAPVITAKINDLHKSFFQTNYSFDSLKVSYNNLMLQYESSIREIINKAEDSLYQALVYARIGNYIDFGAMKSISDEKLQQLLGTAATEVLDANEYNRLKNELSNAKSLAYLTDNCGEIVLDKLLIEVLQKTYPNLTITVIVRGEPVLNDATLEDAQMVGLHSMVPVIGNGTKVPGTALDMISKDAKSCIEAADVILSKGQGNFESLHGCGLNIYYSFLCKCQWFVKRFQLKQFEGVFVNEANLPI